MKSVTQELREKLAICVQKNWMTTATRKELIAIADRIDAEHESEISRAAQLLADAEKDRDFNYANWQDCKQRVLQHDITIDELGAEIERLKDKLAHCIALLVDADGEPIHVGDEMECIESLHPDVPKVFKVQRISMESSGWTLVTYPASYKPENCRHVKQPTVEDVLREFARVGIRVASKDGIEAGKFIFYPDEDMVAEYAAKLQLRGDEE